jgi:hypothetical protein
LESLPPVPTAPLLSPGSFLSSYPPETGPPYAPAGVATSPVAYDSTVRTVHGQPAGRVLSGRYVDLSHSTSAELLKEHEYGNENEEIIIGV